MTEAKWLAATDPTPMLDFLTEKVSNRKLRLFACGCFRRIWHLLIDERSREGVAVFERFVDGQTTADELKKADQAVNAATDDASDRVSEADAIYSEDSLTGGDFAAAEALCSAAYGLCYVAEDVPRVANAASCAASAVQSEQEATVYRKDPEADLDARHAREAALLAETTQQANLIRDIFGNPFQPVTLDQAWLTSDVVTLAQGIYKDRAFDRMPILADALQDAGCDNENILNHCRSDGPHVRGCWVVDLVLGQD
jgi:hypothetical protein